MNKLAVSLITVVTTLLSTACMNSAYNTTENETIDTNNSAMVKKVKASNFDVKNYNDETVKIPVELVFKDEKKEVYVDIKKGSTIDEKVDIILKELSEQCFNGLPILAVVNESGIARIELVELDNSKKSRVSWATDYLNDYAKEYTINNIVKNILREDYKGDFVKEVQLYYNEQLVTAD
ncbi:hypothetical protein [Asaccharospora irregularis]|uniref:Sporulation and spore germination n=1 Tax=Asaccharospora irregularis DSM 2635 TaxID=1121321 RepID=A0A1M5N0K6_9FIRM|nr:hypothetical protein [Asaccharospora irregularis]SHG83078.1 hypothetical protein SAMN04488530_10890 [Asaccharospora irregularis DSM 2635]